MEGVVSEGISIFKEIPFAAPPVPNLEKLRVFDAYVAWAREQTNAKSGQWPPAGIDLLRALRVPDPVMLKIPGISSF